MQYLNIILDPVEIKIPTRPHLSKYLKVHFGQPYNLSQNDYVGSWLFERLRRPRQHPDYSVNEAYSSVFRIIISDEKAFKYGTVHISPLLIVQFNTYITKIFNDGLYNYLEGAMIAGQKIKYASNDFMAKYDIEDGELSCDSILRKFRRYRQHLRELEEVNF